MSDPRQGEIWWAEAEDKRRPVLIVTRSEVIPVLRWVTVAPVTRSVRPIPTHLALGRDEGLPVGCAASFDNLQPVARSLLTERVGRLDAERRGDLCAAIAALADC